MSVYTARARYVPVEKGFNIKRPPIEPMAFLAEKERAFGGDTLTGLILLDLSATLGTDYPATTPFMLGKVEAKFDKGVLRITAAKKPEAVKAKRRIEIKKT